MRRRQNFHKPTRRGAGEGRGALKNLSSHSLSPSPAPSVPVPVSLREVARKVRLSPPKPLNAAMGTPWAGLRSGYCDAPGSEPRIGW